ncbi:hypothetical protein GGI15_001792 [Coemansia interrupta]|uniref:Uncharacterized protein n=1 Tax=Coemansia interrupta TaxID=1126814 RepID=A0A9W8HGK7_9FUNG|nr:hypothetical protein GGI15_001792 [Coemansia interrupta]
MSYSRTHTPAATRIPSPTPLKGTASWPRRRNPLPGAFVHHGLSPRRKQRDSFMSKSADSDFLSDADTLSAGSPSPFSCSPTLVDPEDSFHALQAKQHKRTVNDLLHQLESSEAEIARHISQIDALKLQADDLRRQSSYDRQLYEKQEECLRWQEEQLRGKQEEIATIQRMHKAALRASDKRHSDAVDELSVKLEAAEECVRQMTGRIAEMARELERTRAELDESQGMCAVLNAQLHDVQQIASRAGRLSTDLNDRLNERVAYISELEQRLLSCMHDSPLQCQQQQQQEQHQQQQIFIRSSESAFSSLYAEMVQATQVAGQSSVRPIPDTVHISAEPFSETNSDGSKPFTGPDNGAYSVYPPSLSAARDKYALGGSSTAVACKDETSGPLFWLAVYAHMMWTFYLRLWVLPSWRLAGAAASIVLDMFACRPLGRLVLLILLVPYKLARRTASHIGK